MFEGYCCWVGGVSGVGGYLDVVVFDCYFGVVVVWVLDVDVGVGGVEVLDLGVLVGVLLDGWVLVWYWWIIMFWVFWFSRMVVWGLVGIMMYSW